MRILRSIVRAIGLLFAPASNDGSDPAYHPELHYMRGPGPKWHARRGLPYVPAKRAASTVLDDRFAGI